MLRTWLRQLRKLFGGKAASKRSNRQPKRVQLGVEILETREVPSATVPGYTLSNGNLYNTATSQSPIATNVESFAVGANNEVFFLAGNGDIYAFYQGQSILSQTAGYNVQSFALGAGNEVFFLAGNGDIYAFYQGQSILSQTAGYNVQSFALGAGNEVFFLAGNHDIYAFYQGQSILSQTAGYNVQSFALGAGNEVFFLAGNGDIYAFYQGQSILSQTAGYNVQSFALGAGNEVFFLAGNDDIYAFYQYGSIVQQATNVAWFAPANNGANALVGLTGGGLSYYTFSTNTFGSANNMFVSNGGNFYLDCNGSLVALSSQLWQALGTPQASSVELTNAEYNSIPTGPTVNTFVPVNNGNVYALLSNGDLLYWNNGSWSGTPNLSVAWVAAANSGANALAGLTGGGLSYITPGAPAPGSANNYFVRVGDPNAPDYGAISLIVNGNLVGISWPLWQALGTPQAACIELTDAEYHSIPTGPTVSSFAPINDGRIFAMLSNGDLIYSNNGGWADFPIIPVVTWFAPVNDGNDAFALQQGNGELNYFNGTSWSPSLQTTASDTPSDAQSFFLPNGLDYFQANGQVYSLSSAGHLGPVSLGSLSQTQWDVNQTGYSGTILAVSGGSGGSVTATGLPPGLEASVSGDAISISGTPTQSGTFNDVVVTWSVPGVPWATVNATYSMTINAPPSLGSLSTTQWTANESGYTGSITITGGTASYSIASATGLPPGLQATIAKSTVVFSGAPNTAGTYTIGLSVKDQSGATTNGTYTLTVAPASSLEVIRAGFNYAAGQQQHFSGQLSATGGFGNYNFTAISNLPAGVSVNNAGLVTSTITRAGTYVFTVQATDTALPSLTGTGQMELVVSPGAAYTVKLTAPGTATVGASFSVTVSAFDAYGNGISSSTLVTIGTNQNFNLNLSGGNATGNVTIGKAGTYALTAYVEGVKSAPQNITVNAPAAPPSGGGGGGGGGGVLNPVYNETWEFDVYVANDSEDVGDTEKPIQLYAPFTGTQGDINNQVNNEADTLATEYDASSVDTKLYSKSVASNSPSNSPSSVYSPLSAGNPSAQDSLVLSGSDSTTAGTSAAVTVTVLDANGNVDTGYTGTVSFSSSDQQAGLPASYTFTAADQGNHSFAITLATVGSQTITATDNSGAISEQAFVFVTPLVASLGVNTGPSTTAGTPLAVTVTALDANGQVVPNYTGTVSFSSSDQQAGLPSSYTFTAADQGQHTFAVTLETADTQTLTATDSADAITGQASVTVNAAVTTPSVVYAQTTFTAVANTLTHTPEYFTNIIQADYQHFLGRAANTAELPYWLNVIQHGVTDEQIEAGFLGAPEYIYEHGGSGAGWVVGMYQDLLGRTPAPSEVNYWVAVLNGGTTTQSVAYQFAASAEREGDHVAADYQKYLGRSASQDEVNYWVNLFRSGTTNEQVIAGFVGAPEYFQGHGSDATQWLDAAFEDILDQLPTDSEVQTYLGDLSS